MASGRRSKLEIVFDILQAIRDRGGKIKPTHLLYKSNLSHQKMKVYLQGLEDKGMILQHTEKKGNITYTITDKGYNFLAEFQKLKDFSDAFSI